jgi:hypothetical protein
MDVDVPAGKKTEPPRGDAIAGGIVGARGFKTARERLEGRRGDGLSVLKGEGRAVGPEARDHRRLVLFGRKFGDERRVGVGEMDVLLRFVFRSERQRTDAR